VTPPGKLVHYANSGEGSSSGASGRALAPLVDDSGDEDEEAATARTVFNSADCVLNDEEVATAIQQVAVILEA
jgi:hypothetical protein